MPIPKRVNALTCNWTPPAKRGKFYVWVESKCAPSSGGDGSLSLYLSLALASDHLAGHSVDTVRFSLSLTLSLSALPLHRVPTHRSACTHCGLAVLPRPTLQSYSACAMHFGAAPARLICFTAARDGCFPLLDVSVDYSVDVLLTCHLGFPGRGSHVGRFL